MKKIYFEHSEFYASISRISNFLREHLAKVAVFYSELNYEEISEVVAYPVSKI